ncbi:RHS repeat-associated core domain-containing protein, partial [Pseudovibrio denitrificans]
YSPSGNLLSKSDVGTYSYPAPTAARPHAPTKAGSWTFSYDGNGNMVSGKGRSLIYDGKDRPISVTMGGVTTQYVYGPDDKRLKKISGGQTTLYLGNDEEILPDGTVIKHLDGSVRRVGTTTNWIHRDHMSSVRMLTNSAGTIAAVSRYQPYGKRTDVQQAADTPRESKGWIGERDDPETGLTYLNARYYDADLARFIQSDWFDPLNKGVGTNRYAYALNNPTFYSDPSGNNIFEAIQDFFSSDEDRDLNNLERARESQRGIDEARESIANGRDTAEGLETHIRMLEQERDGYLSKIGSSDIRAAADIVLEAASLGTSGASAKSTNTVVTAVVAGAAVKIVSRRVIRVRHYTSVSSLKKIRSDNALIASDQNRVFLTKAKGKPLSPKDAENTLGIGKGKGNEIVEFDAYLDEIEVVKNPLTKTREITVKGNIDLNGRKPKFGRR